MKDFMRLFIVGIFCKVDRWQTMFKGFSSGGDNIF